MPKSRPKRKGLRSDRAEIIKTKKDTSSSSSTDSNSTTSPAAASTAPPTTTAAGTATVASAAAPAPAAAAATVATVAPLTPPHKPKTIFGRLHQNTRAALVLVKENPDGTVECIQHTPNNHEAYTPVKIATPSPKRTKTDIFRTPTRTNKAFNLKASTPNGTEMVASRSFTLVTQSISSPEPTVYTGYPLSPPRFKNAKQMAETLAALLASDDEEEDNDAQQGLDLSPSLGASPSPSASSSSSDDADSDPEIGESNKKKFKLKGGKDITIQLSQFKRSKEPKENRVMFKTANEAISNAIEANAHKYDFSTLTILRDFATKPFEWLHCLAISLCPKHMKPQVPENLAAGPEWINTYMIVLEEVARYFAKLHKGAVDINSTFVMLNSEVVQKITYTVTVVSPDKHVTKISNEVDAFALKSACTWPSYTDIPQIIYAAKAVQKKAIPSLVKKLDFSVC